MRMWDGLVDALGRARPGREVERGGVAATEAKLARLSEWPRVMPTDIRSLVGESLEHAMTVFNAPRALMAWEDADEPWLRLATLVEGELRLAEEAPAKYDPLVDERLWGLNFFCVNAAEPVAAVATGSSDGLQTRRFRPLHEALRRDYAINSVLALKIDGETVQGHMFILDLPSIAREDLRIGELVANVVASRVDQLSYKVAQREAVNEERIRVARDLHDGLLQSFTGVVLQLETVHELIDNQPDEARRMITQLQGVIMSEQRELRAYVDALRPRGRRAVPEFDFQGRLAELQERFRNEWRVNVHYEIGNMSSVVADALGHETFRLIFEALTNSAKHGDASNIEVKLFTADDRLHISVNDDGVGFPFRGRYDLQQLNAMNQAPSSLGSRVASLNGDLVVESSDAGARLEITVPLGLRGA